MMTSQHNVSITYEIPLYFLLCQGSLAKVWYTRHFTNEKTKTLNFNATFLTNKKCRVYQILTTPLKPKKPIGQKRNKRA